MSFRKVGGVQYSATQNVVKSRYNTTDNLYVNKYVGEPNTVIDFLSDISGNITIYGDLDVSGNVHVSGDIDCSGNVHVSGDIYCSGNETVDGDITAEYMFLSSGTTYTTAANGVVPKSYVDSVATGLNPLPACVLCSNVGPIGLFGNTQIIDEIQLTAVYDGSAVLVNAQGGVGVPAITNGVYIISSGVWSRASYLNIGSTATGTITAILKGTTYANYRFVCTSGTSTSPVFIGSPVIWNAFDIPYSLGQGLEKKTIGNETVIQVNSDLSNNPFITQLAVSGQINALNIGRGGGNIYSNTEVGSSSLGQNTNGYTNSAFGFASLAENTSGNSNTACGSDSLRYNTSGSGNTAIGQQALFNNTTSNYNTAIGSSALFNNKLTDLAVGNTAIGYGAMYSNITGLYSTAVGFQASYYHTASSNTSVGFYALRGSPGSSGSRNCAFGDSALRNNTTGAYNVAIGYHALNDNTSGALNVAIGYLASYYNTASNNTAVGSQALYGSSGSSSGGRNCAFGLNALYANTSGVNNVAVGISSLQANTTGYDNLALGTESLYNNTSNNNVAIGSYSLRANTIGDNIVANGSESLRNNTTGNKNTGIGSQTLFNSTTGAGNTAIGFHSGSNNTTGFNNTFIGYESNCNSNNLFNATAIGANASVTVSNKIRLGNNSVTVIEGQVAYSFPSDVRDKKDIELLDAGIEFINVLKPVRFIWNARNDGIKDIPEVGFIAQDLLQAQKDTGITIPRLVHDEDPEHLSVTHTSIIPILVKAVQELSAKVNTLEAELNQLKSKI